MHRLPALLAALALAATPALAQTPANLQPLPEVPPPPPDMAPMDAALQSEVTARKPDDDLAPQVTIEKREGETVEEHRVNGKLYLIKVTPEHGVPYYLIDREGDGNFSRETMGIPDSSVPMWVIGTF